MKHRTEECVKVMNFLEKINDGKAENIIIPTKFSISKFKVKINCFVRFK